MSSYKNRRFVLLGLAALPVLAACGFTPAFAPGGPAAELKGSILIDAPNEHDGYQLVKHLESRLGQPTSPRFGLSYVITTSVEGVGITTSQETTRYQLVGEVEYTLTDLTTTDVIETGTVKNFTAYAATGSTVSTLAAKRDTRNRLMVILGDQIVNRLIVSKALAAQ